MRAAIRQATRCEPSRPSTFSVVAEPFVFNMAHTANDDASMCRKIGQPIPTARGKAMLGLIEAAIARTPGALVQPPVAAPDNQTSGDESPAGLPTEASLVNVRCAESPHYVFKFSAAGAVLIDVRLRMLQYYELAGAMSFPFSYIFTGTQRDKVRQTGDAARVKTAKALARGAARTSITAARRVHRALVKAACFRRVQAN